MEMPKGLPRAAITEFRHAGLSQVDDVLGLEKLKEICEVMEGGCWAFAHRETDGVRLIANVVKRTTLSSLQEKARARGGVVPVVRTIPEECMRKVDGCVAPRKRVWADLQVHPGEEIKRCKLN